jgi:hypothetical protein
VSSQEAAVIQRLREYDEVADAWFEWEIEHDKEAAVLVVFVHFYGSGRRLRTPLRTKRRHNSAV